MPAPSRRALLRAGLLAATVPFIAAPGSGPAPGHPDGVPVRPLSRSWVERGLRARAAGMERETDRCGVMRVLWGARTTDRVVALTFDDGPSAEYTARVLDALAAADARATFFVVGEQVRRFPDLVRRQRDEGHEHGNHTDTHADLSVLAEEQVRAELERADDALAAALGSRPRLMRPPYGHLSGAALAAAGQLGYDVALWTCAFDELGRDAAGNVDHVVEQLRPGGVVLGHDEGDRRREVGVAALPGLLARLAEQGYRTATVSEVLALDAAARA